MLGSKVFLTPTDTYGFLHRSLLSGGMQEGMNRNNGFKAND
jgi:hypothetical protein